jgi:hypothetical protein
MEVAFSRPEKILGAYRKGTTGEEHCQEDKMDGRWLSADPPCCAASILAVELRIAEHFFVGARTRRRPWPS